MLKKVKILKIKIVESGKRCFHIALVKKGLN